MRLPGVLLLLSAIFFAVAQPAPASAQAAKIPVLASFSILADLAAEVGGERVAVSSLVGFESDAHVYQPAPQDARRVAGARLVFVNGLGFEGWMDRLVQASGGKPAMVVVSKGVKTIRSTDAGHTGADPHAWQDVANAKLYVANIRDALVATDPAGRSDYEANANRYLAKLDGLDAEIRAALSAIPASQRKIVTSHDAFGYFARAYGVTLIAPQGVSTETEASAKDVAKIIRQVKAEKIPAVFLENVTDPRLLQQIARETGAKVGGRLYSDALSRPDGPAGTYIAMMQNNIRELKAALSQ